MSRATSSVRPSAADVGEVGHRPALVVEEVSVSSIELLEGNPRRGDVEAIARSLSKFGQRKPIVVNRRTGQVLAGNHTLLAARSLGWPSIAVCWSDDDEATAAAFALADNRTAELGGYDNELLVAAMRDVLAAEEDLFAATGWTEDDLLDLLDQVDGPADSPDPDDVPAPPKRPFSKPDQIWQLGAHRVICGSATDLSAVERLLAGQQAAMVWTDPPYNVAYESKLAGSIKNDALGADEFRELVGGAMAVIAHVVAPGGAVYVAHSDTERVTFTESYSAAGLKLSAVLVWLKNSATLSRSDYQWRHESILYGWRPGARHRWYGGRKQTTLTGVPALQASPQEDGSWLIPVGDQFAIVSGDNLSVRMVETSVVEVDKPKRSDMHPTTKPVELIERHLRNSSRSDDVVLDCFGGSGSTLMACERTMRRARLVELDPKFVDVICARWQAYTGQMPVLEQTGEPHDFLS